MTLLNLFLSFARIGFFTIGGGYAMIPLIQQEAVIRYSWITTQEFIDIIAIAQITPGAISINSATYIGFKAASIPGALMATFGLFFPSLLIVIIVAGFLLKYQHNIVRQHIFSGIRPVVSALIANAVIIIARTVFFSSGQTGLQWKAILISICAFFLLRQKIRNIHPIAVLLLCAVAGLVFL